MKRRGVIEKADFHSLLKAKKYLQKNKHQQTSQFETLKFNSRTFTVDFLI